MNAWDVCKRQGIIMIGWPCDKHDSKPQVKRFNRINEGDLVIAHVPESHGGAPGLICGIGRIAESCRKVNRIDLPQGDNWPGKFRRQCKIDWLCIEKHDLRKLFNYWRGTVHKLKPEFEYEVRRIYDIQDL